MNKFKTSLLLLPGLIICFIFSTNEIKGFNNTDKVFNEIFNLIYNQRFTEARNELIKSKNKLDKWEDLILNLDLYWWKAISSNTEEDFVFLRSVLDDYAKNLKKAQAHDALEELIYSTFSFRLAVINKQVISIMGSVFKINQLVKQIEIKDLSPEQQDILKIYMALFDIFKSNLLFNNQKLRIEGIGILENYIASSNPVYQTISCYSLSKVFLEVEKSPSKARSYCEQLCRIYPENKIFAYNLELCK
jgi:hypothetical protein